MIILNNKPIIQSNGGTLYLPVIRSVVYNGDIEFVLNELESISKKNQFLNSDNNRRWYSNPPERVVSIKRDSDSIYIYSEVKNKTRLYIYSASLKKNYDEMVARSDIAHVYAHFPISLKRPVKKIVTYLDNFSGAMSLGDQITINLDYQKDLRWKDFSKDDGLSSFGHLDEMIELPETADSPMIYMQKGSEIMGAIGPLDIVPDLHGVMHLWTPLFGVAKKYRRQGYGKKLWNAARNYAASQGARYTLVQAEQGSVAATFYENMSLIKSSILYKYE